MRRGGKIAAIGSFATAEEAALCIARAVAGGAGGGAGCSGSSDGLKYLGLKYLGGRGARADVFHPGMKVNGSIHVGVVGYKLCSSVEFVQGGPLPPRPGPLAPTAMSSAAPGEKRPLDSDEASWTPALSRKLQKKAKHRLAKGLGTLRVRTCGCEPLISSCRCT